MRRRMIGLIERVALGIGMSAVLFLAERRLKRMQARPTPEATRSVIESGPV